MPRRPKGEKLLADVVGNAVHVMRIATGEIEDRVATPESETFGRIHKRLRVTPAMRPV